MSNGSAHGSLNSLRLSQNGSDGNNNPNDVAPSASNFHGLTNGQVFDQSNNPNAILGQLGQGQLLQNVNNDVNSGHQIESQERMMSWNDWNRTANADDQHQNGGIHHNIGQHLLSGGVRQQSDAKQNVGNDSMGVYQSQRDGQSSNQSLACQQQGSTGQAQPSNQNLGNDAQLRNTGGMQLNVLQNPHENQLNPVALENVAAQLNASGIPPNLPPQAHPFYLWMLQQQLANQQGQLAQQTQVQQSHSQQEVAQQNHQQINAPEESCRLAEGDAQRHFQKQEAERIAQEQKHEMLKREEAQKLKQEQDRQKKQREEQAKILEQQQENMRCQEEAQKQQQAHVLTQVNENVTASNALTQSQLTNNVSTNSQQLAQRQLALFQYQLAMAQAQPNNNGQVALPQIPISQGSEENMLRQQQFQLLQALQQQVQHQQVQKGAPLAHTSNQALPSAQPILPKISNKSTLTNAASVPAKKTQRPKKNTPSPSPQTSAVVEAHRQATRVIGNTMKSLNNTMSSINYGVPQQGVLDSQPQSSTVDGANNQMISGSMKSLNTTLASTLTVPPQHHGTTTLNPNQQQGIPIMAYTAQEANAQTNLSSTNQAFIPAQSNAPIASSMNVVSSDTDGEFFAKQGGKVVSDKYATESGTDDDVVLLGAHFATAPDIEDKHTSTK